MKILFAYPTLSSFVKRDLEILKKKHMVVARCIHHRNPFRIIGDWLYVLKSDALFLWFASIYAFPLVLIARLTGKRIFVVVGGYEAANLPQLSYGSARTPVRRWAVRTILRLSTRVLAVSRSSFHEIEENLGIPADRVDLVYHGFEDFLIADVPPREPSVLTVGQINNETWKKKGFDSFFLAARGIPSTIFVHIGAVNFDIAASTGGEIPTNVKFCGVVDFQKLGALYSSCKVYLQLSVHESFGCSVAEAMLCGCIPIVTDSYSLPEVVGDVGIILNSRQPEVFAAAIKRALTMPESEGNRARQRILEHFSYEARERSILELLARFG